MRTIHSTLVISLITIMILSGCMSAEQKAATAAAQTKAAASPTPPPTNTPEPTFTPTASYTPTFTPTPSDTPTPIPTETKTPTATLDKTATAAAESTKVAEILLAMVKADLEPYGLTVDQGELVFYNPGPTDLTVNSYMTYDYTYLGTNLNLVNFILKTDVTWNSTSGLAVCGLIFRAEKNIPQGNIYVFQTLRLSGLPQWDIEYWKASRRDHIVTGSARTSRLIKQDQGSTNTYILVINGGTFTVYANGGKLGIAESTKRSEGVAAYYVMQESGETTCSFTNTWIWQLPK